MTAEATTERPFYKDPTPDQIRRDPHPPLPARERALELARPGHRYALDPAPRPREAPHKGAPALHVRRRDRRFRGLRPPLRAGDAGGHRPAPLGARPRERPAYLDECRHTEIVLEQMAKNGLHPRRFRRWLHGGRSPPGLKREREPPQRARHDQQHGFGPSRRRRARHEPLHRPHRHGPEPSATPIGSAPSTSTTPTRSCMSKSATTGCRASRRATTAGVARRCRPSRRSRS